jgi:hypothetical protein
MADDRRNGESLELVYVPEPAWQPALIALGLAGVVASLFTWWPYGAAGAILVLVGLRSWIKDAREDFNRLPRKQRIATAVIPAVPLQRASKSDS